MELNLPPFMWLFDPYVVALMALPSYVTAISIWASHWYEKREFLGFREVLQIWSRFVLDSAMVMGICGTMIGLLSMIANVGGADQYDAELTYSNIKFALLAFAWGGAMAGFAFAIRDKDHLSNLTLKPIGLMLVIGSTFYLIADLLGNVGLSVRDVFLEPITLKFFGFAFLLCFFFGIANKKSKPCIVVAIESNLSATLAVGAFGICMWFSEGGNYLDSRDAIFFTANVITMGCVNYLLLYFVSLSLGKREQGDFQIKTWHFAEAAAFFIFLVYAPVGSTEFMRESTDQSAVQAQHDAQEIRIEQLEAQIRLLTENQKS